MLPPTPSPLTELHDLWMAPKGRPTYLRVTKLLSISKSLGTTRVSNSPPPILTRAHLCSVNNNTKDPFNSSCKRRGPLFSMHANTTSTEHKLRPAKVDQSFENQLKCSLKQSTKLLVFYQNGSDCYVI